MKKNFMVGLIALASVASVYAAEENHPCKNIMQACQSAGFVKGGHKQGKGLWKDCIQPIKLGKSVSGVNVNANDVQACKQRIEKRREHRKERGQQNNATNAS